MNSLTYNLNIKTTYLEFSNPDGVEFDTATKVAGTDFMQEFFTNNYDLYSNGNFSSLNAIVDNGALKSTLTNGPCVILNTINNNTVTAPYINVNGTGNTSYIFRRYNGAVSIYKTFPVTVIDSNWVANTTPLTITNLMGSSKQFSLADLVNIQSSLPSYLTAYNITQTYFLNNYCEFIPIADVVSNTINLSYLPIYNDFIIFQYNTNTTISNITTDTVDLYNGILTLTPASGVAGYYIIYAAVPLFYINPKPVLIHGVNNSETLTALYLSD